MAISLGDNLGLGGALPVDSRYFDGSVPWADETAAKAGISYRYTGLTVNIAGTEYWWKDGVTDPDLIIKTTSGGGTLNMSGDTVGGLTTYVDATTICAHSGLTFNNGLLTITGEETITSTGAIYSGVPSLCISDTSSRGTMLLESQTDNPTDFFMKVGGNLTWVISSRNAAVNHDLHFYPSTNGTSWAGAALIMTTGGTVCAPTCFRAPAITLTTGAGSGCVLQSDGSGNASWATPSGGGIVMSGDTVGGLTTYVDANTICAQTGATYNGTTLSVKSQSVSSDSFVVVNSADSDNLLRVRENSGRNAQFNLYDRDGVSSVQFTASGVSSINCGLSVGDGATGDNGQVFKLNTERAWGFYQGSSGSSSTMNFVDLSASKNFFIRGYNATAVNGNPIAGFFGAVGDERVRLYYGGAEKLATETDGITVTGDIHIANEEYLRGKNSTGTEGRIIGVSTSNDVYMGAIDNLGGRTIIREDGSDIITISGGNTTIKNELTVNGYWNIIDLPAMQMGAGGITDEYLVLNKKYVSTPFPAYGLNGSIHFQRGGTASGNAMAKVNLLFQTAYSNDYFAKFEVEGFLVYTSIDEITIDGDSYYALKARTSGGGAAYTHQFVGDVYNESADANFLSRVRVSDANVTVVTTDVYKPDIITSSGTAFANDIDVDGDITASNSISLGGPFTLSNSTDRSGLILITGDGSGYNGIQIPADTDALWSVMGQQGNFGLYDDRNSKWIINGLENGGTSIYYDGNEKLTTTSTGVNVIGNVNATVCVCSPVVCATTAFRSGTAGAYRFCSTSGCGCAVDWVATSDRRMKKCIEPITCALSTVDCLCGVCYEFCGDGTKDMGLIAQDVEKVEPRLVAHGEPDEIHKEKYCIEDQTYGLKYDKFAGLFVEAIKELKTQNECLQKQINELRKNK